MNFDKLDKFDSEYFKSLNQEDKEKYFITFVRKTLDMIDKKGECSNDNRL